jgi:chromosome segregation ATPase
VVEAELGEQGRAKSQAQHSLDTANAQLESLVGQKQALLNRMYELWQKDADAKKWQIQREHLVKDQQELAGLTQTLTAELAQLQQEVAQLKEANQERQVSRDEFAKKERTVADALSAVQTSVYKYRGLAKAITEYDAGALVQPLLRKQELILPHHPHCIGRRNRLIE